MRIDPDQATVEAPDAVDNRRIAIITTLGAVS